MTCSLTLRHLIATCQADTKLRAVCVSKSRGSGSILASGEMYAKSILRSTFNSKLHLAGVSQVSKFGAVRQARFVLLQFGTRLLPQSATFYALLLCRRTTSVRAKTWKKIKSDTFPCLKPAHKPNYNWHGACIGLRAEEYQRPETRPT